MNSGRGEVFIRSCRDSEGRGDLAAKILTWTSSATAPHSSKFGWRRSRQSDDNIMAHFVMIEG